MVEGTEIMEETASSGKLRHNNDARLKRKKNSRLRKPCEVVRGVVVHRLAAQRISRQKLEETQGGMDALL